MEMSALKVALLAAGTQTEGALHALHGELEHWLNLNLDSEELHAALLELASAGLVQLRDTTFATTAAGRAMMHEQWEEFFPA